MMLHNVLHDGNPSRVGRNILPAGDFCCAGKHYAGQLRVQSDADRTFSRTNCDKTGHVIGQRR